LIELLWVDAAVLVVASGVAVLDVDVSWHSFRLGRPLYGLLVLAGLLLLYSFVVRQGYVPPPGFLVGFFAAAYLPFLSSAFIDLETTDPRARNELETLLLSRDFRQLLHASDERILEIGVRRLRMHWEGREEDGTLVLELDVHPSLLPVTVSRPHVAVIRDQRHLENVREDVRRRRAVDHMSPGEPAGRKC
jgi:hypothetical protein